MLRGQKNVTIIFLVASNLKTEKCNQYFERHKVVLVSKSKLRVERNITGRVLPGPVAFSVYETAYCLLPHIL